MLTYADKTRALKDLDTIKRRCFDKTFDETSQAVFMCTDKIPIIMEIINNIKKAMIPASSGEGAIEMAKKGIEVYTYDISLVSYYTEQLRIAATLMLEYKEFLAFFYMFESDVIFDEKYYEKYSDATEKPTLAAFEQLKNDKEAIEMELQRSNIMLNSKDHISVKIPPDYHN